MMIDCILVPLKVLVLPLGNFPQNYTVVKEKTGFPFMLLIGSIFKKYLILEIEIQVSSISESSG